MRVCGGAPSTWRPQEPPRGGEAVVVGHVEPTDRGWSPDGRCCSVKTDLALVVAASLVLAQKRKKGPF